MKTQIVRKMLVASALLITMGAASAHGNADNDQYGPGYGMMNGYGGQAGMMGYGNGAGYYGMGPGMMGGAYGPGQGSAAYGPAARYYGMGPGMMGNGFGGGYYGMGPGMMGYGMMGMMMGGGGYGMPGAYGATLTGVLNLTDTQQKKIRQIQEDMGQKQWSLMQAMHSQMYSAYKSDSDLTDLDVKKIMKFQQELSNTRLEMLRNRLEAQKQITETLTKEQREKLKKLSRWGW